MLLASWNDHRDPSRPQLGLNGQRLMLDELPLCALSSRLAAGKADLQRTWSATCGLMRVNCTMSLCFSAKSNGAKMHTILNAIEDEPIDALNLEFLLFNWASKNGKVWNAFLLFVLLCRWKASTG